MSIRNFFSSRLLANNIRNISSPKPRLLQPDSHLRKLSMSSIPTTQKAVQIEKTGGVEVLQYRDLPVPTPTESEVLIKNDFIGVNYIDTFVPLPSLPNLRNSI